jgi:hypothetical protein
VYWLGYVTAVVVLAAYSATLISFLTIQDMEPPVKTLEALAADRTYKLGMSFKYLRVIRDVRLYSSNTKQVPGKTYDAYEGVSKSFRTGRLERELQMVQLSATRCSCIAIL